MCTVLLKHSIEYYCVYIYDYNLPLSTKTYYTHTHTHTHTHSLSRVYIFVHIYGVSSAPATLPSAEPFRYSQKDSVARTRGGYTQERNHVFPPLYISSPSPTSIYTHRIFTVKGSCGNAGTEGAPLRIMPEKAFL